MAFSASQRGWLAMIAVLFAMGTSVLSWSNARTADLAPRFHWPDETSNAFFALRVARGEPFAVPEARNPASGNLIHPRTVNVRADGAFVPGAYLGLPLWYGMVGRAVGERALLFVTPLLAAIGLLAFAAIVRALAGVRLALLATVLLALHPSVWLFTATAFLPNIPFVALLLIGVSVLLHPLSSRGDAEGSHRAAPWYKNVRFLARLGMTSETARWLLGGLLLGLALSIRTHELPWVGALLAVAIVWHRHRSLRGVRSDGDQAERRGHLIVGRLLALGFGLVIPFMPILILNAQLYGSPFTTGYALLQEGGATPTEFSQSAIPGWLAALVAPFGWHPLRAFSNVWRYLVVPYPWLAILAAVGLVVGWATSSGPIGEVNGEVKDVSGRRRFRGFMFSCDRRACDARVYSTRVCDGGACDRRVCDRRVAVVGTIVFLAWLTLYYGSWTIADPLVRVTNVLTISYVRYWLPIVIILAPWAACGLAWLLDRFTPQRRVVATALVVLGIALTSLTQIIADPVEGLVRQRQAIDEHRVRARAVIAATEPNAIILSDRMDKVFFPERAVAHVPTADLDDPTFRQRLASFLPAAPVYWYDAGGGLCARGRFPSVVGTPAFPNGEMLCAVAVDRLRE